MQITAASPEEYIEKIPEEHRKALSNLRAVIKENLPLGFKETMNYGMIGYVVPHKVYPDGYHCDPKLPLPFLSIASQKNFVAIYHMGIYADKELLDWFVSEFPKHSKLKLDMGKSCIRFKKLEHIPFELIGKLVKRMTCEEWIAIYDSNLKR